MILSAAAEEAPSPALSGGATREDKMLTTPSRRHSLAMALFSAMPALFLPTLSRAQAPTVFTCATSRSATPLTRDTVYLAGSARNYGWDMRAIPGSIAAGTCSDEKPFYFSVAEAEGNYQVTVELGGRAASNTTIKAESRRVLVTQAKVAAHGSKIFTFNVNVRVPAIPGGDPVKLKPREVGSPDWDEKLTLEFNGDHPSVRRITIKPIDVPTIYIAGDSTVTDQDKEPWAAWGQVLPLFFGKSIAVSNQAESGETIKSFTAERRFAKIFSTLRKGDFLLIQFAHNDQKPGSGFVSIDEYKQAIRTYEAQARARGATVILITSMNRRAFDDSGHIKQTLGAYPQAMRDVASEDHLALIDLNAMSKQLFEGMGPEGSLKAFVHYPANTFPDQPAELRDDTHFNAYGAYELARCIVQSLCDQHLPLAAYLTPGLPVFDPAHPDPVNAFAIPPSPVASSETPYGR